MTRFKIPVVLAITATIAGGVAMPAAARGLFRTYGGHHHTYTRGGYAGGGGYINYYGPVSPRLFQKTYKDGRIPGLRVDLPGGGWRCEGPREGIREGPRLHHQKRCGANSAIRRG